ncbi:uncharacterized protein LOC135836067 [Planococcus citri]|uniref:uncharacterized protein LOC135836067 n=1 Tax=Planococcus citri TaxID=170843 RepID=UPI0031F9A6F2
MKIWLPNHRNFSVNRNFLLIIHHLRIICIMCLVVSFCEASCPGACDCKWKDGKESVMCVNTNLTTIPLNLDGGILVFNFVGNSLVRLDDDVFERAGLLNLQKLHLVRCNIKVIERYAFRNLNNLVDLDLSYNAFNVVPSQSFAPIPGLRELKLNGNPILKIGKQAFVHVHELIRLEVAECRIGYIDENGFQGLGQTLEWLKLSNNRLVNLKPQTFTTLRALHGIELNDNPLNCSCDVRPLRDWMLDRSLSSSASPVCRYPAHNFNKSWEKLQDDDFACLPSVHAPFKIINAYEGDNVTLACKVGGTPTPNVKWTLRNRVLLNGTFGHPVKNKRSYLIQSVSNNYSNLTILSLEMQDTGEYVCIAENKAGKVITDIVLTIEKSPMGTILSERVVLIGILLTAVIIIFLCSVILFIRVMYCKHDTQADIESKRRIISEKIEMKRNSANLKRSSSILPYAKTADNANKILNEGENQKQNKYDLDSVNEVDGQKPARPKDFKELKNKPNAESKGSPGSSIFESHIGEIALQHHVLHKKELPSGKLYTTAMAFMTDDSMVNYQNEPENSTKKKTRYNTMPRNFSSSNHNRKNMSTYPRVSESQSPLLRSKYYGSSSESVNSNSERISRNDYQQSGFQKSATPSSIRRSKNNSNWAYPSLPTTPDKDKYWTYSANCNSTKETPLLNNIYKKSKNPHVNYSTYSQPKSIIEPVLSTTYDYHAAQLERFLDEYKKLHSELTKMKESCVKFSREEDLNKCLYSSRNFDRRYRSRTSLDQPFSASSFERRFSSRSSLHRSLTPKSTSSFHQPLQSKSCSFERSVSFVPTLKDVSSKTTASDDVIVPKSILKKKNESYYGYDRKYDIDVPYNSSTLPLKKSRFRRFSDSSVEGFFD